MPRRDRAERPDALVLSVRRGGTLVTDVDVEIVSFEAGDEDRIGEVCSLLVRSFRVLSPSWVPTLERAREVVLDALEPGNINRVLLEGDRVAGWVGARHDYGCVWELHPMVVDEGMRGRGHGRALVEDVVRLAEDRGALTLVLGTSDEVGLTSLAARDLFEEPLAALAEIEAEREHPLGFWLAVGFKVVGVLPDAEGIGKPTILLARPIGRRR